MNRTQQLRHAHARVFGIGLTLSILLHGAVLAFVRIDIPVLEKRTTRVIVVDDAAPPVWRERAVRLVALQPPLPRTTPFSGPAASSAAGGSAAAAGPMLGGTPLLPASANPGPAFDRLLVLDPRRNVEDDPVVFTDLPAAVTTPAAEPEPDADQPYVPGSIGKAKRQWASNGDGEAARGAGQGRFVIGVPSGGHCPMPGRGGRAPLW